MKRDGPARGENAQKFVQLFGVHIVQFAPIRPIPTQCLSQQSAATSTSTWEGQHSRHTCTASLVSQLERWPADGAHACTHACPAPTDVHTQLCALVFHPWSWLGGCMSDPTVQALTMGAVGSGMFSMVVKYNVRGCGDSSGWKNFAASADAADAEGVCRCGCRSA